ncbi:MAG: hypothetical protein GX607_08770 [Myxococcales bacterium]|jgi:2-(1,2-epoxy-1,2-dihydrophenyl)acetyl-CoA isomerase|nr:hypothetical protein [Myxococcales bacterium]
MHRTDPSLLVTTEGPVVWLRLNRPARKNALDRDLVQRLGEAVEAATARPETRVVVLQGAGESFCSGADLSSMKPEVLSDGNLGERIEEFHHVIRRIVDAPQPVIACVDGPAVGFGADLALACDLRVLSDRAYLQDSFVHIGLMPDGGGTFWLPSLVGVGRALEFLLLGTRLSAQQCIELGLANRVAPVAELEVTTRGLAEQLAAAAPLAVASIKRAVRSAGREALEAALAREKDGQIALLGSDDLREGVEAFFARRAPRFLGR